MPRKTDPRRVQIVIGYCRLKARRQFIESQRYVWAGAALVGREHHVITPARKVVEDVEIIISVADRGSVSMREEDRRQRGVYWPGRVIDRNDQSVAAASRRINRIGKGIHRDAEWPGTTKLTERGHWIGLCPRDRPCDSP